MRKIITIGESTYQIHFSGNNPRCSFPGGVILNATASLAMSGIDTFMVSETACDYFGNQIADYLKNAGVDTKSLDRFTEGATTLDIYTPDGVMQYGTYPADRFNVVWPRIDENDIVIFGGFYALDASLRERLFEMVKYARERKAIIIYLPGFPHHPNLRITKVMTAILENLEVSNLVIASREHILDIFGSEDASHVFKSNIEFYCPNFICLDEGNAHIFASGKTGSIAINDKARDNEIAADASFLAGTAFSIINNDITCTAIDSTPFDTWLKIAEEGVRFAANTAHDSRTIDAAFAARQAADIASHLSFQP